jgi:uncharacterized protein (TIGR00730 family)
MNTIHTIAVFCGSSEGHDPVYGKKAEELAACLFENRIDLVYGGGSRGLMGIVASTLHDLGGTVTGVLPEALDKPNVRTKAVEDNLYIVPDMHARKAKMYALSDAFVALPGGIGTFEEILEVFTWLQLGYHRKPVALLNVNGYYDRLLEFLWQGCEAGFIKQEHLRTLVTATDPGQLMERLHSFSPYTGDKLS